MIQRTIKNCVKNDDRISREKHMIQINSIEQSGS